MHCFCSRGFFRRFLVGSPFLSLLGSDFCQCVFTSEEIRVMTIHYIHGSVLVLEYLIYCKSKYVVQPSRGVKTQFKEHFSYVKYSAYENSSFAQYGR